jgi:hypothetical protein
MTGLPEFNYPEFRRCAADLRAAGYAVESPAENDNPSGEWADWMRLGIAQVLRVEGIALLPGWEESKGATLELHVAKQLGLPWGSVTAWLSPPRGTLD